MRHKSSCFLFVVLAFVASMTGAQPYPSKAVRIILPFPAGGSTDIQGRLLAKKFQESLGQSFVVENRTGASGLIGAEIAAKSPADGYTLLLTTASLAVSVSLYKKIAFDPLKELQPISRISSMPLVLVVHTSVPARSPQELIALAKSHKGKMNVAHNGSGTTSHLSVEMLRQFAGVDVVSIAYKGGVPAMTAVMSGEADFLFVPALAAQPYIRSGKLRPIAVTAAKRSGALPGLPTMASLYPGFESDNWYAMFSPSGTPKDIVIKLNAEILKALKDNDILAFMRQEGADPVGSSPEELHAYFRMEVEKYAQLIRTRNITMQ